MKQSRRISLADKIRKWKQDNRENFDPNGQTPKLCRRAILGGKEKKTRRQTLGILRVANLFGEKSSKKTVSKVSDGQILFRKKIHAGATNLEGDPVSICSEFKSQDAIENKKICISRHVKQAHTKNFMKTSLPKTPNVAKNYIKQFIAGAALRSRLKVATMKNSSMQKANEKLSERLSTLLKQKNLTPRNKLIEQPHQPQGEAWRRLFSPEQNTYDASKYRWRPRSAFTYFVQDKLSCTSFPVDSTFSEENVNEVKLILKEWWDGATSQERQKYIKMSNKDKVRARKDNDRDPRDGPSTSSTGRPQPLQSASSPSHELSPSIFQSVDSPATPEYTPTTTPSHRTPSSYTLATPRTPPTCTTPITCARIPLTCTPSPSSCTHNFRIVTLWPSTTAVTSRDRSPKQSPNRRRHKPQPDMHSTKEQNNARSDSTKRRKAKRGKLTHHKRVRWTISHPKGVPWFNEEELTEYCHETEKVMRTLLTGLLAVILVVLKSCVHVNNWIMCRVLSGSDAAFKRTVLAGAWLICSFFWIINTLFYR